MAGQKNENWFHKVIKAPAIAREKIKNFSLRILSYLSSAWVGLVASGAALAVISLAFIGPVKYPVWMLSVLGIQEKAGESYPTISNQGIVQLAAEASNIFEKLGPVGDFFGGTVNPILTFISIWLLIHSIKIQRDEMRAATTQAEKSADAAKHAILVSKISERPFVTYYQDTEFNPFICLIDKYIFDRSEVSELSVRYYYNFYLTIENIGKSFAIIESIEIEFCFNIDGKPLKIANLFSTPLGSGVHDTLNCVKSFTLGESSYSEFREGLESNARAKVSIVYEDSFNIKYKTKFNVIVRSIAENYIEYYALRQSFECSLNLDDDPAVEG